MSADPEHISDEELNQLRNCNSESEWNIICDLVKEARGGAYPHDWFAKVVMSRLINQVAARWGCSGDIEIESF